MIGARLGLVEVWECCHGGDGGGGGGGEHGGAAVLDCEPLMENGRCVWVMRSGLRAALPPEVVRRGIPGKCGFLSTMV